MSSKKSRKPWDIAVTGLAVKTAFAENKDQFWENMLNGRDSIQEISDQRMADVDRFLEFSYNLKPDRNKERNRKRYLRCGYLKEIDQLDYRFFRISPKEAGLMDPNQRIFLETVYEAMEDAGVSRSSLKKHKTGVYTGFSDDARVNYFQMIHQIDPTLLPQAVAGNLSSIVPGRVSYFLDLEGPSIMVDTACSSSLVAIHMACQGILTGDCTQAVAGGIRINLIPTAYKDKIGIEAADGRTKTFDDKSDGTGIGEGSAAVVLKPLKQAIKDRDNIYCIVKGSAINQDGYSAGITAPKSESQKKVILEAWERSGVHPEELSFIEIHGTGTRVGDPVEMRALKSAFEEHTQMKQFCAAGSVKTITGHLFEAAGILSFIKAALSIKNRTLPPTINMVCPNRNIPFEESALYINDEAVSLNSPKELNCGITAFGFSGTNCHMVVGEIPKEDRIIKQDSTRFCFTLSAKTPETLTTYISHYSTFLKNNKNLKLQDICFTVNTGREDFKEKLAIITDKTESLQKKLELLTGIPTDRYNEYPDTFHTSSNPHDGVLKKAKGVELPLGKILYNYLKGNKNSWNNFYKKIDCKKVSLPTYPFERNRCWLEIPEPVESGSLEGHMHYSMKWVELTSPLSPSPPPEGLTLVLRSGESAILQEFEKLQTQTLHIQYGPQYMKTGHNSFVLSHNEEDFTKFFSTIGSRTISHIYFIAPSIDGVTNLQNLRDHCQRNLYFLGELGKSLQKFSPHQKVNLTVLANNINLITQEDETLCPENSALAGLAYAIDKECENIRSRCIDFDTRSSNNLILEIASAEKSSRVYAIRNNRVFTERFAPLNIENLKKQPLTFKSKGNYIITGGTGGIGLEIADYISRKTEAPNIYLINRSPFPSADRWQQILEKEEGSKIADKIEKILKVKNRGAKIRALKANVSNIRDMEKAVTEIRESSGKIDGIFHGAGVEGEGLLIRKEVDKFTKVLKPKIDGTWILDHLTREDRPDFLILFSSVATYLMNPGQTDYTAANAFLDTYSDLRNREGLRTLAINWVTWKDTGMAVDYNVNVDIIFKAIPTQKALEAMESLTNRDISKALIGELNINSKLINLLKNAQFDMDLRISKILDTRTDSLRTGPPEEGNKKAKKTLLTGRENRGYSNTELLVARIWGEVLGFDELKIDDNFYELGGDSILATQVVSRINEKLENKISLVEIFNYETITQLARYIEKLNPEFSL